MIYAALIGLSRVSLRLVSLLSELDRLKRNGDVLPWAYIRRPVAMHVVDVSVN